MTLLTVGSRGQLGHDLLQRAGREGIEMVGVDLPECDITDPDRLRKAVEAAGAVEAIINAAAYTAVDRAESEPDMVFAVNRDGPHNLARICREKCIPLIHISTDYVFDGTQRRPYAPSDPIVPLGIYGRSKAEGETAVRNTWERHVIVRTAWLFGLHGPNFVKTMLRLGRERDELGVVDDQIGSPTYAGDLAEALLTIAGQLIKSNAGWGTYHFCNQGVVSWYGFTRRIFELAAPMERFRVQRLIPITTGQYPAAAPRPAYSVLDCASLESRFGIRRRAYDAALQEMIKALYGVTGG
jgi:dTDP-4-dehydrorhamnose reductase